MSKTEARAVGLQELAKRFADLMAHNDTLGKLIEAADENDDGDVMQVCEAAAQLQTMAAKLIGSLAIVTANIDNSSAAVFLGELAGQMVECEMECDPMTLLRGLLGGQ